MRILRRGDTGPSVELLQLALIRAGAKGLSTDGIFGDATIAAVMHFQAANGLAADGIVGKNTQQALQSLYTGYIVHTVRPGDTVWRLARHYGSREDSILTANPGAEIYNLQIGSTLVIPLGFNVVPTTITYCSYLVSLVLSGLKARYPTLIRVGEIGRSVMKKPVWYIELGTGENRVMYNAAHHAEEWITTPLLLKFTEQLCAAAAEGGEIAGYSAAELLAHTTLVLVPAVNPDGIDLETGELQSGSFYENARKIAADYPRYAFPRGWRANIAGTDLNLQYPASWEQARENKAAAGIVSPAPADYVGPAPLSAPESRAMYDFTRFFDPALTIAWHTQGEVIYWQYLGRAPQGSAEIAAAFSGVSGYAAPETPYNSGFAGYKDWFIEAFDRPGFTVEAGLGKNPLPIDEFDGIYKKNLGILALGMLVK